LVFYFRFRILLTLVSRLKCRLKVHEILLGAELLDSTRKTLISRLWPSVLTNPLQTALQNYSAYFKYFQDECKAFKASKPVAIETVGDFLDLVDHLREHRTMTRDSAQVLVFFPKIKSEPRGTIAPTPGDYRQPLAGAMISVQKNKSKMH
jgi:hypothetical protein